MISALSSFPHVTLHDLIAGLRAGSVILLSSDARGRRLTPGSLAGEAVILALTKQLASGQAVLITGHPTIDDRTVQCLITAGADHELAWMSAGGLYEQLSTLVEEGQDWTHVVYLDPWVTNVDARLRALVPGIVRIRMDDAAYRNPVGTPDYWELLEPWYLGLACDAAIPVKDCLALLSPEWWHAQGDARLTQDQSQRIDIVIDETAQSQPAPAIVDLALDHWPDQRIILVTPHWSAYSDTHHATMARCAAALHTDDLTPAIYVALLTRCRRYVAPHGTPFGPQALSCLPPDAIAHVPADDAPGAWFRGTVHPHRSLDELATSLAEGRQPARGQGTPSRAPQPPAAAASAPKGRSESATPDTWFRQLSSLVGDTTSPSPSRPVLGATLPVQHKPVAPRFDIALLTCCYKYLQRFRIFMDSVTRQDYPLERMEVCIAAPGNPDGLREYVTLIRQVYPSLHLTVVDLPESACTNKGKMLNAAFQASSAGRIMVTDCDLVLGPSFIRAILGSHAPDRILGCWRTPMTPEVTAKILVGAIDPVRDFETLRQQWDEGEIKAGVRQGLLGYFQLVTRDAFAAVGYPEEFEGFGQSDIVFVDRLREKLGIMGDFRKDLFVLHLSHHRDWTGTKAFL